jgi:Clp amino terminal domain, pathogenicity island component
MFERFTERARRIVVLAQEEARRLDHSYIGTEHILLGLIREGDGVAAQVLVRLDADQDLLRQRVVLMLHGHPIEEPRLDTSDLDAQIEAARIEKEAAVDARDFEQAASRRNQERQLLTEKAARQELWAAGHPARPDLAEQCRQLIDEVERLRSLLRQHGIDPQDEPA